MVTGIYRVPFTSTKSGVTYNWYVTVTGANVSVKTDGTLSENTTYKTSASYGEDQEKAYSNYVNDKKYSYNVENINI